MLVVFNLACLLNHPCLESIIRIQKLYTQFRSMLMVTAPDDFGLCLEYRLNESNLDIHQGAWFDICLGMENQSPCSNI